MDIQELIFYLILILAAIIVVFGPDLLRHRHKDYNRRTQFRTITERETYERWNDKTPVVTETRERVHNADWVRVEKEPRQRYSPADKVKNMMGKTDLFCAIVAGTIAFMTLFFLIYGFWIAGQIIGGILA